MDAAAVSARHLTRLFQTELGATPARWVERVRLGRAQQLVLDGLGITPTNTGLASPPPSRLTSGDVKAASQW
ncbi:helix-turn-helix domain-containing protein [Arthrobacter sp. Sa2CUA1]|uniref:Helix-turn-helix domain-containing protein n=1 Tax=Arthrobacter gallicola TaxID=2762225 RepID=A0ABR8UQ46_9MICC|nr:helix-turn-helix domain-containing protein [Arthrobacter gallicola]MBD7994638.1 helix-turn-helix domain-containing protein [Arthrobacter gallicola]